MCVCHVEIKRYLLTYLDASAKSVVVCGWLWASRWRENVHSSLVEVEYIVNVDDLVTTMNELRTVA